MSEGLPNLDWCNLRKAHLESMLFAMLEDRDDLQDKIAMLQKEQNIINDILQLHKGEIKDDD